VKDQLPKDFVFFQMDKNVLNPTFGNQISEAIRTQLNHS